MPEGRRLDPVRVAIVILHLTGLSEGDFTGSPAGAFAGSRFAKLTPEAADMLVKQGIEAPEASAKQIRIPDAAPFCFVPRAVILFVGWPLNVC